MGCAGIRRASPSYISHVSTGSALPRSTLPNPVQSLRTCITSHHVHESRSSCTECARPLCEYVRYCFAEGPFASSRWRQKVPLFCPLSARLHAVALHARAACAAVSGKDRSSLSPEPHPRSLRHRLPFCFAPACRSTGGRADRSTGEGADECRTSGRRTGDKYDIKYRHQPVGACG